MKIRRRPDNGDRGSERDDPDKTVNAVLLTIETKQETAISAQDSDYENSGASTDMAIVDSVLSMDKEKSLGSIGETVGEVLKAKSQRTSEFLLSRG